MNAPALPRQIPAFLLTSLLVSMAIVPGRAHVLAPPNNILIFTDDQGHGDIGCFGSETIRKPNIPLGASGDFKGKPQYGPYWDANRETDWSTGQILGKPKELGTDENTLVIFTSDNDPRVEATAGMKPDSRPFIPRNHSGTAAPLRGWKMSAWEGDFDNKPRTPEASAKRRMVPKIPFRPNPR